MAKVTFQHLAQKIIKEEKRPLSPTEIWKIALAKGYDKQMEIKGKTPAASLYTVILTSARDSANTPFIKVGERPARYYLKELIEHQNTSLKELENATGLSESMTPELYDYSEADLHPYLAYYARVHFRAYTKTIRHSTSKKKEVLPTFLWVILV